MSALRVSTTEGEIVLKLLPDLAPQTVAHVVQACRSGAFNPCSFYRSDFALQFGLHGTGREVKPPLAVNESKSSKSNTRGTVAVAHWDVPDNGSSEYFINLKDNTHLDAAYGG